MDGKPMTASEVALHIGRALWLTQANEAVQRTMYTLFEMLGIPFTAETHRQIDDILRPLWSGLR